MCILQTRSNFYWTKKHLFIPYMPWKDNLEPYESTFKAYPQPNESTFWGLNWGYLFQKISSLYTATVRPINFPPTTMIPSNDNLLPLRVLSKPTFNSIWLLLKVKQLSSWSINIDQDVTSLKSILQPRSRLYWIS